MIRQYSNLDSNNLVEAINSVCIDSQWMANISFIPTPEWLDVLNNKDSRHLLLVCSEQDQIVGWCRLFWDDLRNAELGIGLVNGYRRQGRGTELVNNALNWAYSQCIGVISLYCHRQNLGAIEFFMRNGFIKDILVGDVWRMIKYG